MASTSPVAPAETGLARNSVSALQVAIVSMAASVPAAGVALLVHVRCEPPAW